MNKKKKIYVVRSMYMPNTAPLNRMFGHLRAFSRAGWAVEAVFISPNHEKAKVDVQIPNVTFTYCWEGCNITNRYIKAAYSYLLAWRFVKSLPADSKVLLLGAEAYLPFFLRRKDLRLYYETTEHPALERKGWRLKQYINRCKLLTHIFVISRSLEKFFIDEGLDKSKVSIVNMTVDPSRFENLSKTPGIEKYIAYCGIVSNNKDGVDELLKAFAITHKTHPEVKLYIIGATPKKRDRVGNIGLIHELGIQDVVVFTGLVEMIRMPQLLKDATVLALDRPDSLQAQNGFPTKLGEYLLTGNPVVVTKVGDIPLFLKDGETALLSNERDTQEFASKLNWALEHPLEATLIGEKGKQVALSSFDCIIEGQKIISLIQE